MAELTRIGRDLVETVLQDKTLQAAVETLVGVVVTAFPTETACPPPLPPQRNNHDERSRTRRSESQGQAKPVDQQRPKQRSDKILSSILLLSRSGQVLRHRYFHGAHEQGKPLCPGGPSYAFRIPVESMSSQARFRPPRTHRKGRSCE